MKMDVVNHVVFLKDYFVNCGQRRIRVIFTNRVPPDAKLTFFQNHFCMDFFIQFTPFQCKVVMDTLRLS